MFLKQQNNREFMSWRSVLIDVFCKILLSQYLHQMHNFWICSHRKTLLSGISYPPPNEVAGGGGLWSAVRLSVHIFFP